MCVHKIGFLSPHILFDEGKKTKRFFIIIWSKKLTNYKTMKKHLKTVSEHKKSILFF